MSGKKDEDKTRTGSKKAKSSKRVAHQGQNESRPEMVIERSREYSPGSSGSLELPHRRRASSTSCVVSMLERHVSPVKRRHTSSTSGRVPVIQRGNVPSTSSMEPPLEGKALTAQRHTSSPSGTVPPLEGNVSTAQRHTSSTSGTVPPLEGNVSTAQRHTPSTSYPVPQLEGKVSPPQRHTSSTSGTVPPLEGNVSTAQRHTSSTSGTVPTETPPASLPTQTIVDLPEISVENILMGTGGRLNQRLFPPSSSRPPFKLPPYVSLTQKMIQSERRQIKIAKLTEERENQFRIKFGDDTYEEPSSSSAEESSKSDSPSTDLQFPIDL